MLNFIWNKAVIYCFNESDGRWEFWSPSTVANFLAFGIFSCNRCVQVVFQDEARDWSLWIAMCPKFIIGKTKKTNNLRIRGQLNGCQILAKTLTSHLGATHTSQKMRKIHQLMAPIKFWSLFRSIFKEMYLRTNRQTRYIIYITKMI